jgi:hypothetical protein
MLEPPVPSVVLLHILAGFALELSCRRLWTARRLVAGECLVVATGLDDRVSKILVADSDGRYDPARGYRARQRRIKSGHA